LLEDRTEEFFKILFPSWERINFSPDVSYETNNIIFQFLLQYGKIGSGKTETGRAIVEKAVEFYGEENVNAVISDSLMELIRYGLDSKPVQILIYDDATLEDLRSNTLRELFKIRQTYARVSESLNGYVLAIVNTHRFHGLKVNLRTNIDLAIWRSLPSDPYDISVVKRFIGSDGLETLQVIEENRLQDIKWNKVSIFTTRLEKGLLVLSLAKKDYIRRLERPVITLADLLRWAR